MDQRNGWATGSAQAVDDSEPTVGSVCSRQKVSRVRWCSARLLRRSGHPKVLAVHQDAVNATGSHWGSIYETAYAWPKCGFIEEVPTCGQQGSATHLETLCTHQV